MKLLTKLLILIGLTWVSFAAVMSTQVPATTLTRLFILCSIFTLLTLFLLFRFIIQRITKLNKKITTLLRHADYSQRIQVSGNDEITSIANQFNALLDTQQKIERNIDKRIHEKTADLESLNAELNEELFERKNPTRLFTGGQDHEGIKQLAHYDQLTALPNRMFFNEILNKTLSHAKRHKKLLAILLINIDSLKSITATDNNLKDYLIKKIGEHLQKSLRNEDILAKLDGDEFIVLLNDIGKPKFASTVAEKILKACSEPITYHDNHYALTASIGICIYPTDGTSLEYLLKNVNMSLYNAMHKGGNCYQFYTHELDLEAREYIKLDSALRKAIQNNELSLYYQPKLHIKRGTIIGVEALLRWFHPEHGPITPSKFIALAEETGLIMKIGEWTLREACRINKHWQDEGYEHITIAVNLSPVQFYHPDIASIITNILTETGLKPGYLELEITERTVMDDVEKATKILEKIKAIGVQLSIDHFGTGYISISYLKKFPISVIKIDQSFIKGIPNIPNDLAITNAFIGLSHHLGFEVVAEGVETAEQVQYLSTHDCDIVQGYYLSHPLPQDKIILQFKKIAEGVML